MLEEGPKIISSDDAALRLSGNEVCRLNAQEGSSSSFGHKKARHQIRIFSFIFLLIACSAAIQNANGYTWHGYVYASDSHWDIYRTSINLSFDYEDRAEGTIMPLKYHDRVISPVHQHYADVKMNGIRLHERTSAKNGSYSTEGRMSLRSKVRFPIYMNFTKPAGTDVYTIMFAEKWPTTLKATRSTRYVGENINDREMSYNNGDYASSILLYNTELTKNTSSLISVKRINATIRANDDTIISAQFLPNALLNYSIDAHTTGIAELRYGKAGSEYDSRHSTYPTVSEGFDRYTGTYDISRRIEMNSTHLLKWHPNDWLPCCSGGWSDMSDTDRKGISSRIFDCSCFTAPAPTSG
jgi:hypothetical protein